MKNSIKQTKYFKEITLSLVTATFLFSGCGSTGIDDVYIKDVEIQTDYTVQVVDDAVLNSVLISPECTGYEEKGGGYYTLTGCSTKPKTILADGGYFTVTENGVDTNISMGFPLIVNTTMIADSNSYTATPLTTLLASVNTPSELNEIRAKLGFATISDLFKDDEKNRELQQMLNGFFIDAKNNGIGLNQFADFTKDFRAMLKNATGATPLDVMRNAKTKLQDDFKVNQSKYLNKYGVVFGGFIMSNNFTNDPKAFLKDLSTKYDDGSNKVVFSGFIFDDIIGTGAGEKYKTDANITIKDLNDNSFIELNGTNKWVMANAYGNYIAKIDSSKIVEDHSYFLEGSVENNESKQIVLKSLLTGKEILSKFKTNLNSSDIPDLTISNVTSAKAVLIEKQNILTAGADGVIAAKKALENDNSTLLTEVAAGFKTIIDGTAATTGDTYSYISSLVTSPTTFTPANGAMASELQTQITNIGNSTTLKSQLDSTKTYNKFNVTEADIKGKKVVFKRIGYDTDSTLLLFDNNTFSLQQEDNYYLQKYVGNWSIDSSGDIKLLENSGATIVVTLSSIDMGATVVENGKITSVSTNPKGRYTLIIPNSTSSNTLFNVKEISTIDLTKEKAPIIKFSETFLKGKALYEVYYSESSSKYEDKIYRFDPTFAKVKYAEDVSNESDISSQMPYTIDSNGILTINGTTYKILRSYATKLVVQKSSGEIIEFFYSALDAAASKQIQSYDNDTYRTSISSFTPTTSNTYNTLSTDQSILKAIANDGKTSDSGDFTKSFMNKTTTLNSTKAIGTKAELTVIENIGDSQRQRAVLTNFYSLPNCSGVANQGKLMVNVQIRNNKIVYNLRLKDSTGTEYDILDTPVTIIEENTFNKKYNAMIMMFDNQLAIQLSDGLNSYYQYVDLATLWSSKPTYLKSYGYPTSLASSSVGAILYDDGTGYLYKGKMNTPITVKTGNFYQIDGKDANNYPGGQSSVCSTSNTSTPTSTVDTGSTVDNIISNFEETTTSNFELWTDITSTQYNSLSGVDVSFLSESGFGDMWYNLYGTSKHLGATNITINPIPTTTTSGTMSFSETETDKILNGSSWITYNPTLTTESNKITKISNGIYQIYDDTNSPKEELKFTKEFSATELNQLFTNIESNVTVTFNGTDKATLLVVKVLKDYYDWHEAEQSNWGSLPATYYSTLADFIAARKGSSYFTSKNGTNNTGIGFSSNSTGTNGTLVEITNGSITNSNAGTWSIENGILNTYITATGYNYTPAFTIKDNVVWRGEKNIAGNTHGGILYNSSALSKLNTYFTTLFNQQ